MALAVRKSASWLMLETSGELFMITRMRDRGSDTSRCSPPPPLNLAAILCPPRPARRRNGRPPPRGPLGVVVFRGQQGSGAVPASGTGGTTTPVRPRCSARPLAGRREDYKSRGAPRAVRGAEEMAAPR